MVSTHPRTPKGHRTRAHILGVSAELFAEQGYVATTMADVAARSGLSMGGLYRYFGSKEDLFGSLVDEHHVELVRSLDAVWEELGRRPITGVVALNRSLVRFWVGHASVARALEGAAAVEERHREAVASTRAEIVEAIVRRLFVAGLVSDRPATSQIVELLLETTRGAADAAASSGPISEDRAVDLLVDIWCAALIESDAVPHVIDLGPAQSVIGRRD